MKRTFPLLLAICMLSSCTMTSTNNIELNSNSKAVLSQIKSSYHFEEVNTLSTSKGGAENGEFLTLQLVNGQNLPVDSALSTLGMNFANALAQTLDTTYNFKSISVVFMTKNGTSLASSTTSTSFSYNLRQSKNNP